MKKKQSSLADRIQPKAWLAISLIAALIVWTILSVLPNTSRSFPNAIVTIQQIKVMLDRGVLLTDIASSLISVSLGYILGFALALPMAILMAWYLPVRNVIQPWILFIRAARVLGAKDKDIFVRVIAPASLPFILTAVRLGASTALTTLIAAESTGAMAGLGMRIRSLNSNYEAKPMLLYIIIIGIIGISVEKLIKFAERKLTGWQEKREL